MAVWRRLFGRKRGTGGPNDPTRPTSLPRARPGAARDDATGPPGAAVPPDVAAEQTLRAGLGAGAPEGFHRTAPFREACAALVAAGRELLAVDLLRTYVSRNPGDYELRRTFAERLLARGDVEPAHAQLLHCADAPDPRIRAWALFELADDHTRKGEDARALAMYQEVLAIDYDYPRARERARELAGRLGAGAPQLPVAPPEAIAPDRLMVGRFRVRRELGRGGAGTVYLALDDTADRDVAVKVLHPHLAGRDRSRRRFFREARAAAAVSHPGVITIYDLDEKLTAIAMQYHPGGSLADRLRAGPLPPREALRVAVEVAAALGAIHAAGIVHRDVKPGNVLFRDDGGPVLTDFGVAGLGAAAAPEDALPGDAGAAAAGDAVGTLAYMAPEQRAGEPPRAPNDVWALGALVFEMLAGRPPFSAEDLARAAPTAPPDPAAAAAPLEAGLRPHLVALLARLLAPAPDGRIASADEARTEIARLARWVTMGGERRARYADLARVSALAGGGAQRRALLDAHAAALGVLPDEAREIEAALVS